MADITFADIDTRNNANVRKALRGGVWLAPEATTAITTLTVDSTVTPGTPTLAALPAGYYGLGWLSEAGAVFSEAISSADINGWGGLEPVRRDITSDVTTVQVVGLETTKGMLATYYNVPEASITPDATTGEVHVDKPSTPQATYYRMLVLGVDGTDANPFYTARFLPRASITSKGGQTFSLADTTGIAWDITLTAYTDSTLGFAERFIGAGAGWQAALTAMGFGA